MTQERSVKFGSLIALNKHLIIKGVGLSLFFISTIAEAIIYTVTSNADAGANTLRDSITSANLASGNTVDFNVGLNNIVLGVAALPNIQNNMTINADNAGANFSIDNANLTVNNSVTLTLQGDNIGHWGATTTVINNGTVAMNVIENDDWRGIMSGAGNLNINTLAAKSIAFNKKNTYSGTTNLTGTLVLGVNNVVLNDALPTTTALSMQPGAFLIFPTIVPASRAQTLGGLSGSGSVVFQNLSAMTIGGDNMNTSYSGDIISNVAVANSITKVGTGALTLSGNNTFSGAITINNGTVRVAGGAITTATVGITSMGGTTPALEMNGGTIATAITGDGTANSNLLVTGVFTPTAATTNVGTISVNAGGNYTLNNLGVVPTVFQSFNVNNGGIVTLNTGLTIPATKTLAITGGSILNDTITNNGTMNWNGGTVSSVIAGAAGSILNLQGIETATSAITNVPTINVTGGTFTANTAITGYTSLNVSSGATLLQTGGNLNNGIALGGTYTYSGGNFAGNVIGTGLSTMNVNAAFVAPATVSVNTLNVNAGGTFTSNNTTTVTSLLNVNPTGTLVLANHLTAPTTMTLTNAGTLTMGGFNILLAPGSIFNSNSNLTTAGSILQNGASGYTLNVGNNSTLTVQNPISNYGSVNVASGSTLVLNNVGDLSNGINLPGGTFTYNGGNFAGNVSGTGLSTMNVNTNFAPAGTVAVNTLNVPNAVTFTANNLTAVTGGLNVALGGTLLFGNTLTMPANSTLTNNGTLTMNNLNLLMGTGSTFNSNTNLTTTGSIALAPSATGYALNVGNAATLTVNNAITGYNSPLMVTAGSTVVLNPTGSLSNSLSLNASTFTVNGGSYTGNVVGTLGTNSTMNINTSLTPPGSISVDNLNVGGGATLTVNNPITGYTTFTAANGSNIILNNGGVLSNTIALNNSTLTVNGGTFSGNINGVGLSTLNINNAFIAPGSIAVNTLNVNNGATFTPSTAVSTLSGLNVNSGGTLLLTNNIVGNVTNAGTITHTDNAVRTITGNFTQTASGTMNLAITNPQQYTQLQVNGNTTINGGAVNIALPSTIVVDGGEVFNIINSTGSLTLNALPSVPKTSLFLDFVPTLNGNTLQLIANRTSYETVNETPALDGVAAGLDGLIKDNGYNSLLAIVDHITTVSEYETLLEQLAPTGLNGSYTPQGLGGQEQILARLDSLRETDIGVIAKTEYTKTGYAAGDMLENQGSYGPMVFGSSAKQSDRGGLPGYKSFTGGFGFLGDVPILQYFRVGLGASYASSSVKQADNTGSKTTTGSAQGLVYGSAAYGPLFLDSVLSAGMNNYNGKRNIIVLGQTATSSYKGFQYGAKVKAGFTIPFYQIEISPIGTLQYMHLKTGSYTEKGAGILNLVVDPVRISTVRAGLGGRIADNSQKEDFFPEIHAFYIVDVRNPNLEITSRFVEGGGAFVSTGVLPPKGGVTVGASITALVSDNFVLSGSYDLEAKKSYRSHSASLKFKFLF